MGKKVYASGESAVVHVEVKNNSNVDVESFTVKVTKLQYSRYVGTFFSRQSHLPKRHEFEQGMNALFFSVNIVIIIIVEMCSALSFE